MDGGYTFPKSLVNALIGSIFLSLMGIAGYMVSWNANDLVDRQKKTSSIQAQAERLARLEERVNLHLGIVVHDPENKENH